MVPHLQALSRRCRVECCDLGVLDLTPPPPVVMTTADSAGQLEVAPQVLVKSAGHQV